jgi:hypothetical protein
MACRIFFNVFNDSAFVCSYLCLSKKCFGEKPNGKAKPKTDVQDAEETMHPRANP